MLLPLAFYLVLSVVCLGPVAWMLTRPDRAVLHLPYIPEVVADTPDYTLDWIGLV